jgi:polysaccharide export outer membrane protein
MLNTLGRSFILGIAVLFSAGACTTDLSVPPPTIQTQAESSKMIPVSYIVGAGDELEILYHINPGISVPEYVIDTEDTLKVEFFYYPVMNKTARVRPDGYITLPRIGDVLARGKKPADLAAELSKAYEPHLNRPKITVEVSNFNVKIEELKKTIYNVQRGMSRLAVVRPDGQISLPYVGDVKAAGLTTVELRDALRKDYQKIVNALDVTVIVLKATSNRVYILGEVMRPDYYQLNGPIRLSQLLAMAGGFTADAQQDQAVIIRRSSAGTPDAEIIHIGEIFGAEVLNDPFLNQYDVIYIPRTALAKTALTADFIYRLIPINIGLDYQLGGNKLK